MYCFIVVGHADLAVSLVKTAEFIMKADFSERCKVFSIDYSMLADMNSIKEEIERALDRFVEAGRRVIIFVDIFGGSPANVSFTLVKKEGVDVVTGVSLPMLIYAFEHCDDAVPVSRMVDGILQAGRDHLISAKKLLEKQGKVSS